jgi:nitrogenase molybdenum-iron protein alpha/beta subunit
VSAAPTGAPQAQVDYSGRVSLSFTIGCYLAVNAVSDAYLLVDAPDCAHLKTQYIQSNHDWFSTLTRVDGIHRVANTDLHPWKIVAARDDQVQGMLKELAAYEGTGAVLVTSMPMATITGVDYDRLCRPVSQETGKPVVNVPGNGLTGDWLDGFGDTLKALARAIELDGHEPEAGNVAVVGYLWDRCEGDHQGNLAEMRRLLKALGLTLGSVWLSGGSVADLREVRRASAIVALPYARDAARILGERLGVPVIETGLPLGLHGSEQWLRQVAEALGRSGRLAAVVDAELAHAVPKIEWAVPHYLLHRRMVFVGDPHLALAFEPVAEELGLALERHFVVSRRVHARELLARAGEQRVALDPTQTALERDTIALIDRGRCDLLVTNSIGYPPRATKAAVVELGFPSYFTHVLEERPTFFFRGLLNLVERMTNELRRAEIVAAAAPAAGRAGEAHR